MRRGSIPAWAGEPSERCPTAPAGRVYPRVGGGTRGQTGIPPLCGGLSPRGRGNLRCADCGKQRHGSIPAWAGEPAPPPRRHAPCWVYPRVGGGTLWGSPWKWSRRGLSPRGRGNLWLVTTGSYEDGSIPAWAGEPPAPWSAWQLPKVYPRVGGGTRFWKTWKTRLNGLSPRGRGNHQVPLAGAKETGSIPAWAGEPGCYTHTSYPARVYPRVGGGTSRFGGQQPQCQGLSPRGRGNHVHVDTPFRWAGSIPAWAGEPTRKLVIVNMSKVYPRVGGGTTPLPGGGSAAGGLSPRGRGNLGRVLEGQSEDGSIPAWAGEPASCTSAGTWSWVYPRVGGGTAWKPQ